MLPDHPIHSVLVIDDDPTILLLLGAVARRNGLACVTASDGESALRHLRGRDFDVILLDLNLPTVNGLEVLQVIREEAPHLLERTIVVSGAPRELLDELRAEAGVWRVIAKPVDIRELESEVMACLGEQLIRRQMNE